MISDKIVPAVQMSDVVPSEMSAEEFQKRLYRWFEDRGLLSELRAHLRKQMIGALKDTSIGHVAFTQSNKSVVSPKTQAFNLLVGEFLLRYDYHYSLSVFSTEVPLTNTIPEVPMPINSSPPDKGSCREWKFAEGDMWDILETMGVARESEIAKKIYHAYYEEGEQPLLAYLIKFPNRVLGSVDANFECLLSSNTYDDWARAVGELLHSNQVNAQQIKSVLNSIVSIVDGERKHLQEECTSLRAKLSQYESTQKQLEVEEYRGKLLHHQNLLQERYHQLILREREVQQREYRLEEKEQQLAVREKCLQTTLKESEQGAGKDNELITQLQTENKALQDIKEEQGRRIDELTEKSTILLRDLESAQTAVNILTSGGLRPSTHTKEKSSPSSSASDDGTTNVRREARELLERLTKESEEMDRHYQQFKRQSHRNGLKQFADTVRPRSFRDPFQLKAGHSLDYFSDLELSKPSCSLKRGENVPCKDTDSASSGLDHTFPLSISEATSDNVPSN
ncbi:hypothetical protein PPYR_07429 [Photinus pyralis]|uniref:Uncharacterized protein n=1 Tax=Photinus pyralis TaxID=7054 RepID=A0A1Y1LE20_PHOPY|nr:oral-facial-digital syndrome 1 protein [Photinus pyralis]KAB0799549.1 hypothetical protein PPYR_07429 [Photinus pyralis]